MRWKVPLPAVLLLLALGCGESAPVAATAVSTPTSLAEATATGEPMIATPTATPTLPAPTATPTPSGSYVVLEGVDFEVELAITPEERAQGLMGRASLDDAQGMLFIYERDNVPGFWMRGMLISLDLVWIDAGGVVAGVEASVPPAQGEGQPPVYHPPRPIRYVLEVNAGTAERLGIGSGSHAIFVGIPVEGQS